jgi:c(7)-type cytochrome triheme protein
MHRFASHRRRALLLVLLPVLALGATLIRPAAPAQEKEPDKKEEHGGDIVFHVLDKKRKYSVLYSHEKHLSAGCKCEECHGKAEKDPHIFEKKIGSNHFRMKDVNQGQFCGKCHNASPGADVTHKAFPPKSNCSKCHNVQVREEK